MNKRVLRTSFSRRRFLKSTVGLSAVQALAGLAAKPALADQDGAPAIVTSERLRPKIPYGVMTGDITLDRAIVWSKTDRPAQMIVELEGGKGFGGKRRIMGPQALADNDFTARVDLSGLPLGREIEYRVYFQSLDNPRARSEAVEGRFRTPSSHRRDIRFAFSGDEAGQGWGINQAFGGYRLYETMRRARPDFFIHSGDQVYADGPLKPEVTLDDGSIWRNVIVPAKTKVAETLDEFRGNFAYNLMDLNKRRFAAEVPFLVQWDDHETRNNWYPGQIIGIPAYTEKHVDVLSARARQAMFEYNPFRIDGLDPNRVYRSFNFGPLLDVFMLDERSYRGANSPNVQTTLDANSAFLGPQQLDWIKRGLLTSNATWKVVASDMPLGLVVPDGNADVPPGNFEAWANANNGVPSGRELELANLLSFIKANRIRNVVWITADVHYAAAHRYDPAGAAFKDFDPFWEFVAGPINAGTFGPNALDLTFGPEVKFNSLPPGTKPNRPPSDGLQFFGLAEIEDKSGVMTVELRNLDGKTLFSVELEPHLS
jgi:alkaline phosphatase D